MATHFAEELTAPEFAGFVNASTVGVLPVAAIEPHGPHLPLSTDADIARGHLARLADVVPAGADVLVLPLQTIGYSAEHAQFAGTFSHAPDLLLRGWQDIARSFAVSGGRRLIVVSSHGGNSDVVSLLIARLRARGMLAVTASWLRFGQPEGLFDPEELAHGIHGGDVETSLMLHYWPEAVRQAELADFRSSGTAIDAQSAQLRAHGRTRFGWLTADLNVEGAVGNATLASAAKGAASAAHALAGFAELIADVAGFDLERLTPVPQLDWPLE